MEKLESLEKQRALCEGCFDDLRELAQIHIEIDPQERRIAPEKPDWIFRLRTVYFHVIAITECDISADGIHIISAELRPVYEQMDILWKCLPHEFRLEEDRKLWTEEARDGLAQYNHPTMVSLALPLLKGGFGDVEVEPIYLQTVVWLGNFIRGYSLALAYLARVLGAESETDSRLLSVLDNSIR
ncbi:MAG: hypothetical protein F4246_08520 [Rhodothermaceae bacterium]|nr:hypothetical protein [Rhodothermaceae bacterium]MXX57650.1 hypothetical protein [Rhodothermaceae bacterium]MYD19855.1 hypothetical protein [Rhodothermaceae bacterium]MYD57044.1 hypothetical protein [Rhodothermaceae bacterium]MYI44765.1 hypothetical protein [Rhodothermaceae bacterium]